ncbi:restriction endonuclease subunit S [Actinomadura geliboluensis]|uniref:restriction endonuclease subunit S n=1 Tax=Actinomadura geliboluensis TaxID=882440 RepID=UPI0026030598|nr:restriction endonuclease subunit S [Actinomadura geliboluensis]
MTRINNVTLGEVARFIRGITFKPDDVVPRDSPNSVWCMRTKNVQSQLDLSDLWAVRAAFVKRPEQYLMAGDLLVSSANSWNLVGKCCWIPKLEHDSTFGGFVSVLRADTNKIHPRYLYHWFSSSRVQATIRSFGRQTTNISNLDTKRCLQMSIPLPPLDAQQNIAELLDQADAFRAKRREAIGLLDELTQSIFLDMFGDPSINRNGWPVRTIGDLIESATYGTGQKAAKEGDLPVLRMGNLTTQGRVDLADLKYLRGDEVDPRHLVSPGDLLFNRTNSADLVGKTAVYRSGPPMAYAGYLVRARTNSRGNPEYISAFLNSRYGKRVLRSMCKSIIGMANINAREMQAIRIPAPPVDLQHEFARRVYEVERERARQESQLPVLDELFDSLQQRAFRGELWED